MAAGGKGGASRISTGVLLQDPGSSSTTAILKTRLRRQDYLFLDCVDDNSRWDEMLSHLEETICYNKSRLQVTVSNHSAENRSQTPDGTSLNGPPARAPSWTIGFLGQRKTFIWENFPRAERHIIAALVRTSQTSPRRTHCFWYQLPHLPHMLLLWIKLSHH